MNLIQNTQELEIFQTLIQWIAEKKVKTSHDAEKLLFKTFPLISQNETYRLVSKFCTYRQKIEAIVQESTGDNPRHVSPSDCEDSS